MRKTMIMGALAGAAIATAGCGMAHSQNGREDQGPTVERKYPVGQFNRIDLAGAYDVTIQTGAAPGVTARGAEKTMERLTVEVRNGVLFIHPEKRKGINWGRSDHGKVTVNVTVPSLAGAQLAGAGDIRINEVKGDEFVGELAGSGNLTIDRVEVGSLKFEIAGAGSAKGSGRARTVEYEIAGAGDIDAKAIAAETASVSIAGAGSVAANASGTAKVQIMGAGDVEMIGGAKCTISKAGAGNVRCS